jgi:hypothetical protein
MSAMKSLFMKVFPILFLSGMVYGQTFEFKVLASKGVNKVKVGTDWKGIKTGATIFGNSQLEIGAGSYLGLMHKTGKTLEIKTPGKYNVNDLSKQILTGGSSVASKYGEYLLAHMSESESEDVNMDRLNNMNVTGAVSRATDNEKLDIIIPERSSLLTVADATFRWIPNPNVKGDKYVVTIDNLLEENIATKTVDNPWFDLESLEGINLEEQMGFIINVKSESDPEYFSSNYALSMFMEENRDALLKELNEYKTDLPVEEEAMRNFLLANFYENNGLKFHALSCYTKLLVQDPENEFYAASYLEFMDRNGMEEK